MAKYQLCRASVNPTLDIVAQYLAEPANQDLYFTIEEAVSKKLK